MGGRFPALGCLPVAINVDTDSALDGQPPEKLDVQNGVSSL